MPGSYTGCLITKKKKKKALKKKQRKKLLIICEKTLKSVSMNHLGRAILLTLPLSLLFSEQAGQFVHQGLWSSRSQRERVTITGHCGHLEPS